MKRIYGAHRVRYRHLLEDEDVRRWYQNVARGSRVTADTYLRRIGSACASRGLSLGFFAEKAAGDEKWLYDFALDLVTGLEGEGRAGGYVASSLKALWSWLSHNGVEFKRRVKVRGADDTPTLRGRRTLTPSEFRSLFLNCSPRPRCAAAFVSQSAPVPSAKTAAVLDHRH